MGMKMPSTATQNKRGFKFFVMLGLALLLIFSVIIPVGVTYAKSLDELVPQDSQKDAIYNKYGVSKYSFQTGTKERQFWQVGAKAKDGIVSAYDQMISMGFLGNVQLTRFFTYIAREAFTFSFMNDLIDGAEEIIQNITGIKLGTIQSGSFWDSLGMNFVYITVIYILWLMLRARFLDGMQQILSFVMALVISLAFFSNAGIFLKSLNNLGTYAGEGIYAGLSRATGLNPDQQDGVTIIADQVWQELVLRPYSLLQYDDTNVMKNDPALFDKILNTEPFSDERENALKEAAKKYPGVNSTRSAEQIIILLVNLGFSIVILGLFTFWSLATIYMRLRFLTHAIVMSITLLASLLPGREAGISVIRSQFIKLLGMAAMTLITMFFLQLSLVVGHFVYDIVTVKANKGWFLGMILEAIAVFVIFKYRDEIGSVFTKVSGAIPAMPKAKSAVLDTVQRAATRGLYTGAANKISGLFNKQEPAGVPSTFSPNSLSKANTDLNAATNSSMMLRYQKEKQASEALAQENGEAVQYSPFVQRVNQNLRNGTKNPFRGLDKEWKEEKSRLKDVKEDGGNVKQAILSHGVQEGMNDQEVAATMYGNEHAIRKAASFMVQRPKRDIEQMNRAKTLNRNRKLQTAVDDFCMIQLFDRYKVEHKTAVQESTVSGQPVKHTDFVKNMDSRFKEAGLNTTQKVNDTMLVKSGRISIASHFEGMKEFDAYKMNLLKANEAFRKVSPPTEGITLPGPSIRVSAPISKDAVVAQMPKLPDSKQSTSLKNMSSTVSLHVKPVSIETKLNPLTNMKNVNFKSADLKSKMEEAKQTLGKSVQLDDLRLEIDTSTKHQVVVDMKQKASSMKHKISGDVSNGLQEEMNHLKHMQRSRQVATVSQASANLSQKVQNQAKTVRQSKKNSNNQS
ncbi:hypothetical protein YDYSY3_39750 [Paenibacillus chitinolyticus]|uniref:CD3337/EF1877 family mobilome membrane protein n=1 Tax=Paenibacillus chitinolyticus TaxID=79263 RepID=UPI0026E4A144|nr:hypothetical protein [Paenibacillus chitinolyticus]GKS12975.1 hypothetical protein YDYSY3_39750 [Paenibacillus chitinolyticus]